MSMARTNNYIVKRFPPSTLDSRRYVLYRDPFQKKSENFGPFFTLKVGIIYCFYTEV